MKQRSACERLNSVIDSYHIDRATRNPAYGLIRLTLVTIVEHAVIRYMEALKRYDSPKAYIADTLKQIGVHYFDTS